MKTWYSRVHFHEIENIYNRSLWRSGHLRSKNSVTKIKHDLKKYFTIAPIVIKDVIKNDYSSELSGEINILPGESIN